MNEFNILDIKDIELGSIVTRVYPTPRKFGRDESYVGEKFELISFDEKIIALKSLEKSPMQRDCYLPIDRYKYGWVKYISNKKEKYSESNYSDRRKQLMIQNNYIESCMRKFQYKDSEKFENYMLIHRYLKEKEKAYEK